MVLCDYGSVRTERCDLVWLQLVTNHGFFVLIHLIMVYRVCITIQANDYNWFDPRCALSQGFFFVAITAIFEAIKAILKGIPNMAICVYKRLLILIVLMVGVGLKNLNHSSLYTCDFR